MAGGKNIWENVIIFVLLGVVVCFLTPLIQGIFYKSKISGAKTSAENLIDTAEILYQDLSLYREVVLPFTVQFRENKTYDLYENTTKIAANQLLEKGQRPTNGSIVIDSDGGIYAQNITYNDIICNMEKNKEMVCVRKAKIEK